MALEDGAAGGAVIRRRLFLEVRPHPMIRQPDQEILAPMCNDYRLRASVAAIEAAFSDLKIPLRFDDGVPNLEPRDDIRITDVAAMVRTVEGVPGEGDLVQRRWSWPGPRGRPVYNFRADGRNFATNRCLIVADGFYEFTDPEDPGKKRKNKWLFTKRDEPIFCIAGIWRDTEDVGEAFTMLTMPPGSDIAPYHDRQIVVLERDAWAGWLDPSAPAASLVRPLPAGTLLVEQVG